MQGGKLSAQDLLRTIKALRPHSKAFNAIFVDEAIEELSNRGEAAFEGSHHSIHFGGVAREVYHDETRIN